MEQRQSYLTLISKNLLSSLKSFLEKAQIFLQKFPKIILTSILIIFILAIYYGQKVKIAVRTEDFGNQKLNSYQDMQVLKKEFAMEDRLTFIFHKPKKLNSQDLCLISNWIKSTIKADFPIDKIMSGFDLRYVKQTDDGNIFYPKIFEDPCNNNVHFNELFNHPLYAMYFSPEFNDFTVHFQLMPEEQELKHGIYDYKHVKSLIEFAKSVPFELKIGGTLFFQSSVLDGIKATNLLNFLAGSFFLIGFYYFYRSKIATLALLFIIGFTTQVVKLLMYLFAVKIDPLTSCIFLMLTVAIIEDFVFLSYLVFYKQKSFPNAIKELTLPSFLTSLTTAIGFGSLAISTNPNIVQFAIWTSFGAMFEWMMIFWILPSLYLLKAEKIDLIFKNTSTRQFKFNFISKIYPKRILTIFLILVMFIIPFIFDRANLSYSPFDMFTSSHEISKFRNYFLLTRKSEGEISIVFENNSKPSIEFIEELKKVNRISKVFTISDFEPHLRNFDISIQRMILSDLDNSDVGKLYQSKNVNRVIALINSYDTLHIPRIQNDIDQLCKKLMSNQCRTFGEVIVSKDYAVGVLKTLYESFVFCFLLIVLIIAWLTFSVDKKLFIPIILSVVWAPIVLLILVIVFQFKVNVITCVALSLIVGLGGDNAIQFLLLNSKNDIKETVTDFGQASIQVLFLLIIVSSTLILSYFRTTKILSLLMFISVFLMLIGDIWILNGLLNFFEKKKTT